MTQIPFFKSSFAIICANFASYSFVNILSSTNKANRGHSETVCVHRILGNLKYFGMRRQPKIIIQNKKFSAFSPVERVISACDDLVILSFLKMPFSLWFGVWIAGVFLFFRTFFRVLRLIDQLFPAKAQSLNDSYKFTTLIFAPIYTIDFFMTLKPINSMAF